ncbi:MAG TPA: tetratricopeptide repeat protein [Thermoanaerobaculia bacterium]|nr:tetratricopeptide repeat protein [Thermoanaerobaculia bacterium]
MISSSEDRERVVLEFDGFRLDPVRRLLTLGGEPVPITPKALSILAALLERPGEVMEKKELIEKVWPGVFVSEANLTQNIFSLRKTLRERANDTHYVVTVPSQGYKFVGEVRRIERFATSEFPIVTMESLAMEPVPMAPVAMEPPPAVFSPAIPAQAIPAPAAEEAAVFGDETMAAAIPAPPPDSRLPLAIWGVLAALVVTGAVLAVFLFPTPRAARGSAAGASSPVRSAIAVLDFKSLSPGKGTRWLQSAFAEMLTTELAAGGSMRVIRGEAVADALRSLAIRDPSSLGRAELERLHQMLGADLVVVGSYTPIGGRIRLDLRVLQAPEGDTVVSLIKTGPQSGLFELVSGTGAELRKSLGFAELSPRQVLEVQALRPSSPEASRLYVDGLTLLRKFDPPGALRSLQSAAQVEPGSAVIHAELSQAWSFMGYDARAQEEARKAVALAVALPREQRLAIEGRLHRASKDWEKASQTYRTLWTFFPDDIEYALQLAESLLAGGRGAEAASILAAARKLPPPVGEDPRIDLVEARNARRLADFATEKSAGERAAAKGRRSGQRLVTSQGLIMQGDALVRTGHPEEAIRLFREAVELAKAGGFQWGTGMALANLGVGLQVLGDLDGAQKANEESLAIARRLGTAVGIAAQLDGLGELSQERGDLAKAFSLLEQSLDWYVKLGDRVSQTRVLNRSGTVLLAQGDLVEAKRRFQSSLTLSQAVGNRIYQGLALGNLGNVLALEGDLGEARRRHTEAFALLARVGDASLAASELAASADAAARLGELRSAWQQSARALEAKRQSGDRIGVGRLLGSRAWLAYELGDLAASQALAEEQLRIGHQTGARSLVAWALQNLGRIELAAGNLAGARKSLEESLRVSSDLKEDLRAMEVRLDLAALALAANRPDEAAPLVRQTVAWYQTRGMVSGEVRSLALLAESLLRLGSWEEASRIALAARGRLEGSEDQELRTSVAISLARFEMAAGKPQEALRLLRQAAADAEKAGFAVAGLEARLALGEIQTGLGDPAAGAALAAVRKKAETLGFKRLAVSTGLPPAPSVPRTLVSG